MTAERETWPVHQPEAFDAPIPGRQWYSGCDDTRPRVDPATGRCEGCGEPACVDCGKENCPDHPVRVDARAGDLDRVPAVTVPAACNATSEAHDKATDRLRRRTHGRAHTRSISARLPGLLARAGALHPLLRSRPSRTRPDVGLADRLAQPIEPAKPRRLPVPLFNLAAAPLASPSARLPRRPRRRVEEAAATRGVASLVGQFWQLETMGYSFRMWLEVNIAV